MKVFHGSYIRIDKIDLSKAMPNKDFGKGFYVTKIRHHAENWAKVIGNKHNTDGFVTEFEYLDDDFTRTICKILRFDSYNEQWLDFVVMNRNRSTHACAHDYDIVEGPVADDKVQITLRLYLKGKIPKGKFLDMLSMHEETHQICFCTLNSLQCIDGINNTHTLDLAVISSPIIEKLMFRNHVDEKKATDIFYSSAIFARLSDAATGLHQKTWQEVYDMLLQEIER